MMGPGDRDVQWNRGRFPSQDYGSLPRLSRGVTAAHPDCTCRDTFGVANDEYGTFNLLSLNMICDLLPIGPFYA